MLVVLAAQVYEHDIQDSCIHQFGPLQLALSGENAGDGAG